MRSGLACRARHPAPSRGGPAAAQCVGPAARARAAVGTPVSWNSRRPPPT